MQKVEYDEIHDVPCERQAAVPIPFQSLILLHVIQLSNIIHLVNDQLLDKELVVLGMELQTQNSVV